MNEINLPPLPASKRGFMGLDGRDPLPVYTADEFRAGQLEAVEKDRAERVGVPDAIAKAVIAEGDSYALQMHSARTEAEARALKTEWANSIGILLSAAPQPVQEAQPVLDCDVAPRPLSYPLKDYHHAMTDGPLHFTWQDKPHRIVYDLIAAVRFYAQPVQREPLTDEQDRALCEGHCNTASDEYFTARPQIDSQVNRRIFYAGHRKAWIEYEAAHGITKKG